jgi:hypothetical protein
VLERFELPGRLSRRCRGLELLGREYGLRALLSVMRTGLASPIGSSRAPLAAFLAVAGLLLGVLDARPSRAQSTIRSPGEHDPSRFELEPHVVLGPFDPPGGGAGVGVGGGFRAGFQILQAGFVPTINDSVAIGVGADFLHYGGHRAVDRGTCTRFASGPNGTIVCVEVSQAGGPSNYAFFPIVLQWNFWLTRHWSLFGEPGLSLYWSDYRSVGVVPNFFGGGRYRFNDNVALTFRLGYPSFTLGLSILF